MSNTTFLYFARFWQFFMIFFYHFNFLPFSTFFSQFFRIWQYANSPWKIFRRFYYWFMLFRSICSGKIPQKIKNIDRNRAENFHGYDILIQLLVVAWPLHAFVTEVRGASIAYILFVRVCKKKIHVFKVNICGNISSHIESSCAQAYTIPHTCNSHE